MTISFGVYLVLWLFDLFYNVWVCVCVGFVMCGGLGICVLVFTVFLHCFMYI